jgi:hypothetical protein
MIVDQTNYPYDSGHYYLLSRSFISDGNFSLLNFPVTYRGIIFPLLLYPFNKIAEIIFGSSYLGWRLLISLLSAFFTITFPLIFKPVGKIHFIPIPLFFCIIIWRGLFLVPLSDLVAIYFLIFALACFNKANFYLCTESINFSQLFFYFISGIMFYASYNARTIYLFAFMVIPLFFFCNICIGKLKKIINLFTLIMGIFLLGCIQGISNKYLYNKFSIFVPTQNYNRSANESLFLSQLKWGMEMSFYETYMGNEEKYAAYKYKDISGLQMVATRDSIMNYADYFKTIFKYPIETLGLYVKHFFVLMNPIGGGGYVYSRDNSRFIFTLMNFTMLFVMLNYFKRNIFKKYTPPPPPPPPTLVNNIFYFFFLFFFFFFFFLIVF